MKPVLAAAVVLLALALGLLAWKTAPPAAAPATRASGVSTRGDVVLTSPQVEPSPAARELAPEASRSAVTDMSEPAEAHPAAAWERRVVPALATLRGHVRQPDGEGAPGYSLLANGAGCVSGPDGGFQIDIPVDGLEWVRVEARRTGVLAGALELLLEEGQVMERCELQVHPQGAIEGVALDARGIALAGADVSVTSYKAFEAPAVRTDEQGRFRVDGLTPGLHYAALAGFDGFGATAAVEVRAHETSRVVLGGAHPSIRVRGRITAMPVGSVGVLRGICDAQGAFLDHPRSRSVVDPTGRFELELPGPGVFTFWLRSDTADVAFPAIKVPPISSISLELPYPAGRIEGVVLDETGRGAPADVWIRPLGHHLRADAVILHDPCRAGENGRFSRPGIPFGSYDVGAEGRAPVRVRISREEPVATLTLRGMAPGALSGVVLEASGEVAAGAEILVFDAGGHWVFPDARSSWNGRFEVRDLPPGTYRVAARQGTEASLPSPPVMLRAGDAPPVELRLREGTLLQVALRDPRGALLAARWSVRDATGCERAGIVLEPELERLALHGPGLLEPRFGPLPPGECRIEALAPDGTLVRRTVRLSGAPEQRVELRLP